MTMRPEDNRTPISRRKWLKGAGAGSLAALAGCFSNQGGSSTGTPTATGGGDDSYKIGISMTHQSDAFVRMLTKTSEWYVEDAGHQSMTANAELETTKQNRQVRNMLNSGIDALLISPLSSEATASVIEEADNQDVPVFTYSTTTNSDLVKLYTAFGNKEAAYLAGKKIGKRVKDSGGSRILQVIGNYQVQIGVARSEGFKKAIEEMDGVEVIQTVQTDWSRKEATQSTVSYLQKDKDVDAIYGITGTLTLGALQGLRRMDMANKRSEEGHVIVGALDAYPRILEEIKKGYIDLGIDQPNAFYSALSIHYILEYLESRDDSVLPSAGQTISGGDITFQGGTHKGVNPWDTPSSYWAPADVVPYEVDGEEIHPQVQTQAIPVTKENVDKPYHWANVAEKTLD